MADDFTVFDVQRLVRGLSDRGLDLTNPRGVILHGKTYPTTAKHITVHNPKTSTYSTKIDVPLESGNLIRISGEHGWKDLGNDTYGELLYPVTHKHNNDVLVHTYAQGFHAKAHEGVHPEHQAFFPETLTPENAHDIMKNWSSAPSLGRYVEHPGEMYTGGTRMTPEQFMRHSQAMAAAPYHIRSSGVMVDHPTEGLSAQYFDNSYAKVFVPRNKIHVEAFNQGTRAFDHYAYDPENETLKRAEVD